MKNSKFKKKYTIFLLCMLAIGFTAVVILAAVINKSTLSQSELTPKEAFDSYVSDMTAAVWN